MGLKASILSLAALVLALAILAQLIYRLPAQQSLLFSVGVFVLFYIPGNLLLTALGTADRRGSRGVILSTAVGTLLVPVVYLFFRRYTVPDTFIVSFFAVVFLAWLIARTNTSSNNTSRIGFAHRDIFSVGVLILIISALLHFSHFSDIVLSDNGFRIRSSFLTESIFHQGIINALTHSWPPPSIYASGTTDFSSYHLGMHLHAELINRLLSVDTLYLTYFYAPFLYFVLISLSIYQLIVFLGGHRVLAAFAGLLPFGSDFSFIPGLLGMLESGYPWLLTFNPTIWSLFTLNGLLPSLIGLVLSIYFFTLFFESGNKRILLLPCLIAFAAYSFKSSMGLHLIGVFLLIGAAMLIREKDKDTGSILTPLALLFLAVIALDILLWRSGTGENSVAFAPLMHYHKTLEFIGFGTTPAYLTPLIYILFMLAALGVKALGLLSLKAAVGYRKNPDWPVIYLIVFVLSGYLFSDLIWIGNARGEDNSGWFATQSLLGASILLSLYLARIWNNKAGAPLFPVLILALLAAPSTIQFLTLRYDPVYIEFDNDDADLIQQMQSIEGNAVVLHPLNEGKPSLASTFAGKTSVVNVFRSFINQDLSDERVADTRVFFDPRAGFNYRALVLKKYRVDYVYAPRSLARSLTSPGLLEPVYSNDKWILYRTGF